MLNRIKLFLYFILAVFCHEVRAQQVLQSDVPFIGAQVFIEPGQTSEQIDRWFSVMEENGLTVCRIRMFQQYMEREDGTWDFTLFDHAFCSAERHGVKVYCTFFPTTERTDIGGWKFPSTAAQHESFMTFVRQLVEHYYKHPALKGWVLINEPGIGNDLPVTPFMKDAYAQWIEKNPELLWDAEGYPILTEPRQHTFIADYTAEYLKRIADEVRRIDTNHDIHVNPADVFGNYGEYRFDRWRQFLTSLGGSAHPAWHYTIFPRQRFAHAMAIEAEILRGASGQLPWFMTEIQGGNNTYSGGKAMCPTVVETAQWLWTVIGTEGKGGIFWSLNARAAGIESGEWAMVTFQDKASERLRAAGTVAKAMQAEKAFFSNAREQLSGIDIVYTRESRWAEQIMHHKNDSYEAREDRAVFKAVAACHQALADRGIQASVIALDDYDFTANDYSGRTIILPHQIAIPKEAKAQLETFVSSGGTLIVEGLTAYYDAHLHCTMMGNYWQSLLGADVSEFICTDDTTIDDDGLVLPVHWQRGVINYIETSNHRNVEKKSVSSDNSCKTPHLLVHNIGRGRVVWFPSCIALGAWTSDNYRPLSDWFLRHIASTKSVRFEDYHEGILMRVLTNGKDIVTVCMNKSGKTQSVQLQNIPENAKPQVLFTNGTASVKDKNVMMDAEGLIVIKWSM